MGEVKLTASLASESTFATQHEYECHDNPADQLWRDGIVLCPSNLMSCTHLAASWTFNRHNSDAPEAA
jgi:hypothetical protein